MATVKKRKAGAECWAFSIKQTCNYVVLTWTESLWRKKVNFKSHYRWKHTAKSDSLRGQTLLDKVDALWWSLFGLQAAFARHILTQAMLMWASIAESVPGAKTLKPFSEGEFQRSFVAERAVAPDKVKQSQSVGLSQRTVDDWYGTTRYWKKISTEGHYKKCLKCHINMWDYCSLAVTVSHGTCTKCEDLFQQVVLVLTDSE